MILKIYFDKEEPTVTNHEYNLIICTLALDSEDTVEQIL